MVWRGKAKPRPDGEYHPDEDLWYCGCKSPRPASAGKSYSDKNYKREYLKCDECNFFLWKDLAAVVQQTRSVATKVKSRSLLSSQDSRSSKTLASRPKARTSKLSKEVRSLNDDELKLLLGAEDDHEEDAILSDTGFGEPSTSLSSRGKGKQSIAQRARLPTSTHDFEDDYIVISESDAVDPPAPSKSSKQAKSSSSSTKGRRVTDLQLSDDEFDIPSELEIESMTTRQTARNQSHAQDSGTKKRLRVPSQDSDDDVLLVSPHAARSIASRATSRKKSKPNVSSEWRFPEKSKYEGMTVWEVRPGYISTIRGMRKKQQLGEDWDGFEEACIAAGLAIAGGSDVASIVSDSEDEDDSTGQRRASFKVKLSKSAMRSKLSMCEGNVRPSSKSAGTSRSTPWSASRSQQWSTPKVTRFEADEVESSISSEARNLSQMESDVLARFQDISREKRIKLNENTKSGIEAGLMVMAGFLFGVDMDLDSHESTSPGARKRVEAMRNAWYSKTGR